MAQKSNNKLSGKVFEIYAPMPAPIAKINENPQLLRGWLSTAMKILIVTSYGIKKVIEIIRDWPI